MLDFINTKYYQLCSVNLIELKLNLDMENALKWIDWLMLSHPALFFLINAWNKFVIEQKAFPNIGAVNILNVPRGILVPRFIFEFEDGEFKVFRMLYGEI